MRGMRYERRNDGEQGENEERRREGMQNEKWEGWDKIGGGMEGKDEIRKGGDARRRMGGGERKR